MKLYNTLTRQTEELHPLQGNTIKLYTCGLTVYSQPHIGNWVGYIYWDILVRALKNAGYQVVRTQNYTDVGHLVSDDDSGEDKMEKGARAEGKTAWDIAEKYIGIADREGYDLLGLVRPDYLIRATDYIQQQIAFAKILEEKGFTYIIPGEGLYFDTSKLADYGKLARLDIAGLEAGARVPIEGKRNITDFAIWKFSPIQQKRDMEWDSPWGVGFPGWHLECSVIARETLGDQIDIHTGGIDHIPVHHTNEIAQTEAVTGKPFSQFWVHNNHIKVDGTKISKSLGNIYTLQDLIDRGYALDVFKVMTLSKHYSTEGNFTWESLESSRNRLKHWQEAMATRWQTNRLPKADKAIDAADFSKQLATSLADNLDTPKALQLLDSIADAALAGAVSGDCLDTIGSQVATILNIQIAVDDITTGQKQLLDERERARDDKDWAKSDELRDILTAQKIGLRDTPNGVLWYPL